MKSLGQKGPFNLGTRLILYMKNRGVQLLAQGPTDSQRQGWASSPVCIVAESYPTLRNPMDSSPPGFSVHGDSPGKNTGVGCHALLQGIFPTQGLNPVFPHCRRIPYHLSHQEALSLLFPRPHRLRVTLALLWAALSPVMC